ncbi:MAG: methionine sulfoxide reductase [Gemmatimonadetes bacterium]|nr:methionine sulfoxide reductase [Gemmatimonadota bacterium]
MRLVLAATVAVAFTAAMTASRRPSAEAAIDIPAYAGDDTASSAIASPLDTAVIAGGCFWGIEAVYEHMKGVKSATSGYAGGTTNSPTYDDVSSGDTGHAESVQVVFDPSQVSYGQILQVYFSVAHDPTQLNRQGPDVGTQYRSAIFYRNDAQRKAAEAYIAQLTAAKAYKRPIVTQVVALKAFHQAEAYHQDYMVHHPDQPYIVYNDAPKVEHLKSQFPALYRSEWGGR